jgi:hypothetical protein
VANRFVSSALIAHRSDFSLIAHSQALRAADQRTPPICGHVVAAVDAADYAEFPHGMKFVSLRGSIFSRPPCVVLNFVATTPDRQLEAVMFARIVMLAVNGA